MERVLSADGEVAEMLDRLADEIIAAHQDAASLTLVGIRTGGDHLARRLAGIIKQKTGAGPRLGVMDITLYRDDWTTMGPKPKVGRSEILFSLDDAAVVLVDDVLFTGRTVRAALDALIDFGRPRFIELAVLVDRGHRELPIQPNYVGITLKTRREENVDVLLNEEGGRDDAVVLKGK